MIQSADFIVAGGGIVGLSAAIALRQRGWRVVVLESGGFTADIQDPAQRVYAINEASQTFFQDIGVWSHLDPARMTPYQRMHVWDGESNKAIDFDARMIARDRLGVMLEEAPLKMALIHHAQAVGVDCIAHWQTHSIDLQDEAIYIQSADHAWCAQGLIVADGARSPTRDLLGVEMVTWPYHQQAIVAKVRTEKTHDRTAFQVFCSEGPLAFLPMANPHESAIVWSTSPSHAQRLLGLSQIEFEQHLMQAFQHRLGETELLSKCNTFPLQMQHVKRYTGPRWVVMGDAAHTIHPMAGLGLNIGLADLTQWLRLFPQQSRYIPTQRMTRGYQRERKHALWQVIMFLQVLHTLFTHSYLPIKVLRGLGLTLCHQLPFVKRLLIEHAMGTNGES
jgi:2-octaprenylphenol hydroxylase